MPVFISLAFTRWRLHWMWWRTFNCSPLLIYRPREDERLNWPGWLTYSGRLTQISGHPSATGRAQDGERTLARDWRSTAEPREPTVFGLISHERLKLVRVNQSINNYLSIHHDMITETRSRQWIWRFDGVGSDVGQINEVTLRRARLVLGWVTAWGFNSSCGKFISV